MPNWAEGNIRFRGKPENIMAFLENELEFVATNRKSLGVEYLPVNVEWDDMGGFLVSPPDEVTPRNDLDWEHVYIRGTRRNHIEHVEGYLNKDADNGTVVFDGFVAAWGVEPEPYVEKAKKYGIDIKIIVYESGMQFRQEIVIINGELVKDEETKYDDYDWDCDFPNMGG